MIVREQALPHRQRVAAERLDIPHPESMWDVGEGVQACRDSRMIAREQALPYRVLQSGRPQVTTKSSSDA
jgi:hypothetical protein